MGIYQNRRHYGIYCCCTLALLAGLLFPAVDGKSRQQVQAAEHLENMLVKAPGQTVTNFKISASTMDSVTLSWTKASDAQTYYISYWESGKPSTSIDREDIGDVSEYTITNLRQVKYIFQIQPANKLHTGIPLKGAIAKTEGAPGASVPTDVRLNRVKTGYCSFTVDGLDSLYQSEAEIYDASDLNTVLETSEGDCAGVVIEDDSIKNNGFYAVRVRGFYDQDGGYRSYGGWSDYLYFSTAIKPVKLSQKNGRATIKWQPVHGAEAYTVYLSQSATGGFQKAAETGKTSFVATKYKGNKLKPGKVYYIKVVAEMTRENKTYKSESAVYKIKIK